jgi:hypothetical protein
MFNEIDKLKAEVARLKTQYVTARVSGWLDGYQHCADTARALAANNDVPLVDKLQHSAKAHKSAINGQMH